MRHTLRDLVLTLLGVFLCLPLLVVILFSFSSSSTGISLNPTSFSVAAYQELIIDSQWASAVGRSIAVGVSATALALLLGTAAALGLTRVLSTRASRNLRTLILLPLVVPLVITGMGTLRVMTILGIRGNLAILVIVHAGLVLPYTTLLLEGALRHIDPTLELAGQTLGATRGRTIRSILLPNILPAMAGASIIAFYTSWEELIVTSFVASFRDTTLPLLIFQEMQNRITPTIAALATVGILVYGAVAAAGLTFTRRRRVRQSRSMAIAEELHQT